YNDFPFVQPDLHLVLVDPLRPGNEQGFHPGEAVLRMADVVIVVKVDSATAADIQQVTDTARAINPDAVVGRGRSPVMLDDPDLVRNHRVLVIEDGPTLTHGGMSHGAGYVAAVNAGAASIVDPRPFATDTMRAVFEQYPHIGKVLPAVGYSRAQLDALQQTIKRSDAEVVVCGTPCDLGQLIATDRPWVRARYEFEESDND
ncbi:MAG: GTPase, partial [Candidatus Eisenbacteria bacterium]|nr:GTPase [Candidatus Eisenbacteria bacterium]